MKILFSGYLVMAPDGRTGDQKDTDENGGNNIPPPLARGEKRRVK